MIPLLCWALSVHALPERQITSTPKNHNLDNNDNFSGDGKFLVYDTREVVGPGIENSQSIEKVELATGDETVLYAPHPTVLGAKAAPGAGAATFSPTENKVAFIHGPFLQEVPFRGWYAKPNRCGALVDADGSGRMQWLDARDVATDRDTIPGAHRGGTHRHEFSLDGKRVGFTYDDFILTQYARTIGCMFPNEKAPSPASHYFAILVPVVPQGTAKTGEIETAVGDSWIGAQGLMRAFIGKVREDDGSYTESLFVVDVPADLDITTADSGSATRFPAPPKGLTVRRLTHTPASGVVRGTVQGDRIAYFAPDDKGMKQVFVIASNGSDKDPDPAKRPVQLTDFPKGVQGGLRWHPSGNTVLCVSEGAIVATCAKPGPQFGKSVFLTGKDDNAPRFDPVWSLDGNVIAYNRAVPTPGPGGKPAKTYNGKDMVQIFAIDFPDADSDGIAD
jgi:hypothetical protein